MNLLQKTTSMGHFLSGARDETRTHNPVREADFKSAAYTNSATRASINIFGGAYQSCTGLRGFADRCVTAPPTRHATIISQEKPQPTGWGAFYSLRSLSAIGMANGTNITTVASRAYLNSISAARLIAQTAPR